MSNSGQDTSSLFSICNHLWVVPERLGVGSQVQTILGSTF